MVIIKGLLLVGDTISKKSIQSFINKLCGDAGTSTAIKKNTKKNLIYFRK